MTPAAAAQLLITQQPPNSIQVNRKFGLTASIEDSYGNLETGDNAAVTVGLASNPGGATLGGTITVNSIAGVVTFFGLTLDAAAAGYTLQVSGSGLSGATTSPITVNPVPATELVITQEPSTSLTAGTPFGLTVQAEDDSGEFAATFTGVVTVALANNPSGATLGGMLTASASGGVATFSGLMLTKAGIRLHDRRFQQRSGRRDHDGRQRECRAGLAGADHEAAAGERRRGHRLRRPGPDRRPIRQPGAGRGQHRDGGAGE